LFDRKMEIRCLTLLQLGLLTTTAAATATTGVTNHYIGPKE